jgi:ribosomal-protein-alanine N-acetyltransferase
MMVILETPSSGRRQEFLRLVALSRHLHRNRVTPPDTPERYNEYLRQAHGARQENFLVVDKISGELAGVVNINDIVRGQFQSAYLGYYAFSPHAGTGLMRQGLHKVITYSFRILRLHRLEANMMPDNKRSIALVEGLGFRLEGMSPRYLKICGRWQDHQRWAILAEEWRPTVVHRSKSSA